MQYEFTHKKPIASVAKLYYVTLELINRLFSMIRLLKIAAPLSILVIALLSYIIFYNTNSKIHFIENSDFDNIHDIISQNQFKDKCILIDMWFASCISCIEEFQFLPTIKEELKTLPVEYLYLSRDQGTVRQLAWKNRIKKYDLTGSHMCLPRPLLVNVWDTIHNNTTIYGRKGKPFPKNVQVYPHYLIVNREGRIVDYNAPNPSNTDSLIQRIKSFL